MQSGALEAAKGTTVSVFSEGALIAGNSVVDTLTFESSTASLVVGTTDDVGHLSFGSISGTNAGHFLLDIFSADSCDRLSGSMTPGSLLSISAANGNPLGTTNISGNGTFELKGGSLRSGLNAGAMAMKNIRLDGGSLVLHSTAYWGTGISGRSIEILGEGSRLTLGISATYGGFSYAVYVNKAAQDSVATLYVSTASDAIPEPTTATLSLLTLSQLAARRRRK